MSAGEFSSRTGDNGAHGPGEVRTATGGIYRPREARGVLLVLTGMALMVTYVETMVLPAFGQFYTFFDHVPYTTLAWILSAYLLVGTVATPIFGKLGDKYGKKRMLLVVMGVYAAAVSIAGFTPNLGSALGLSVSSSVYLLIAARAFQGIGMAMFPLAFAMIPEVFPATGVGPAQGIVSAMFAGGAALGLVGGGYIAQNYGWQLTYHTVIPVAVILVVLAAVILVESRHKETSPTDLVGVTSLGLSLTFFLLAVTEGSSWGWLNFGALHAGGLPWGVPEFLLVAAVLAAVFVLWETRTRYPVVSFARLRERNIWISNVNGVFVGMVMFLFFVTLVLLAENPTSTGFSLNGFQFGLMAAPSAVAMLISGPFVGRAVTRYGPKPVTLLGFVLMAGAAAGLALLHSSLPAVVVLAIPGLVGNVAVLIAMSNMIVLSVDRTELGIQTGMNQTFRNLGSAVGPVVATTVVASFVTTELVKVSPRVSVPVSIPASLGYEVSFALAGALAVMGLVLSLGLRNFRFSATGVREGAPVRGAATGGPVASPGSEAASHP